MTGIVFGLARAFGEALAVQMVIGNSIKFANNLLSPTATLTSILTMDMGNTVSGTAWNDALWSLALLFLVISFLFILIIRVIGRRGEVKYECKSKDKIATIILYVISVFVVLLLVL